MPSIRMRNANRTHRGPRRHKYPVCHRDYATELKQRKKRNYIKHLVLDSSQETTTLDEGQVTPSSVCEGTQNAFANLDNLASLCVQEIVPAVEEQEDEQRRQREKRKRSSSNRIVFDEITSDCNIVISDETSDKLSQQSVDVTSPRLYPEINSMFNTTMGLSSALPQNQSKPRRRVAVRQQLTVACIENSPISARARRRGITTIQDLKATITTEALEVLREFERTFRSTQESCEVVSQKLDKSKKRGIYASVQEIRRSIVARHPVLQLASIDQVEGALEWLRELGVVRRYQRFSGGKVYYRLLTLRDRKSLKFSEFMEYKPKLPITVQQQKDGSVSLTFKSDRTSIMEHWNEVVALTLRLATSR